MTAATQDAAPTGLDRAILAGLVERQDGVVSRRQLLELGARAWEVRRLLRRRELTTVHPGVYVNHTGALSSEQRRWAAVLAHWPAAIGMTSALPGHKHDAVVHVVISHGRTVQSSSGVQVHRITRFDGRVRWNLSPPTMVIEDAVVEVALREKDTLARFEIFAAACRSRRTNAERLLVEVGRRRRLGERQLIVDMLADLESGACSVLEREYLRLEERHGLPSGSRQAEAEFSGRAGFQDVTYSQQTMVVELDGRTDHGGQPITWDDDHERDLRTAVDRDTFTVRLTYGQVFHHGCRTIAAVAELLRRRGWHGELLPCPACDCEDQAGAPVSLGGT